MIDIHAHILPYIDDGAEDLSDALLMAELAVESGVHTIVATPHCNIPGEADNYLSSELLLHFKRFQETIEQQKLPLRILPGMEIFATDDVAEKIKKKKLLSLNNSGRYLVEFDFYLSGETITERLEDICEAGALPIVAHPERYACVQKHPGIVFDWLDMGCQLQMNRGSVFGSFGKYSAMAAGWLIRNDLITYIASDAHSPYRRTTYMKDIQEFLRDEFSASYARKILEENPRNYLIEKHK